MNVQKHAYLDYNFKSWAAGQHMNSHDHPYFQIIHVISGTLEVDYGSGWQKIASGALHLLPARHTHRLKTTHGHSQFGLNFNPNVDARQIIPALERFTPMPTVIDCPFLSHWKDILNDEMRLPALTRLLKILNTLDQYCLSVLERLSAAPTAKLQERLFHLLEANIDRAISVDEIANQLHLSRAGLQRYCKSHFDCGVAHLHERLRLQRAENLLLRGLSISQCAAESGYRDIPLFSRAFKRLFGDSPSRYAKSRDKKSL